MIDKIKKNDSNYDNLIIDSFYNGSGEANIVFEIKFDAMDADYFANQYMKYLQLKLCDMYGDKILKDNHYLDYTGSKDDLFDSVVTLYTYRCYIHVNEDCIKSINNQITKEQHFELLNRHFSYNLIRDSLESMLDLGRRESMKKSMKKSMFKLYRGK